MAKVRSIGVAQTVPVPGDVAANVQQHVQLVHAAAEYSPDVLVFPELSLTGYELELGRELAFSERDTRLSPLAGAAAAHSMTLVVGAPVRIGAGLHIAAFILSADGSVELYTKHHLGAFSPSDNAEGAVPPPEDAFFQPGTRSPLIRFAGNAAAVAICADTSHPSHPEAAAKLGANTYLAGSFIIPLHIGFKGAQLRHYAIEHGIAVAFANYGGSTGGLPSGGKSAVWSQKGELVADLPAEGLGVAVATEADSGWRGHRMTLDG